MQPPSGRLDCQLIIRDSGANQLQRTSVCAKRASLYLSMTRMLRHHATFVPLVTLKACMHKSPQSQQAMNTQADICTFHHQRVLLISWDTQESEVCANVPPQHGHMTDYRDMPSLKEGCVCNKYDFAHVSSQCVCQVQILKAQHMHAHILQTDLTDSKHIYNPSQTSCHASAFRPVSSNAQTETERTASVSSDNAPELESMRMYCSSAASLSRLRDDLVSTCGTGLRD